MTKVTYMLIKPRSFIISVLLIWVFLFSGCSSIPLSKPKPPVVSIASVVPMNLSFTQQKLKFKLKVFNPNTYEVPLESIDFVALLSGKKMATGNSDQQVTLPAEGHEFVDIEIVIGVNKLLDQVRSIFESADLNAGYNITGRVKLANWPSKIPFDVVGEVNPNPPQKL